MNRRLLTIDLLLKVALVLFLLHTVVFPDLPQYQGKGIGWRLLLYPVSSILVPLVWFALRRRGGVGGDYPYLIDICVGLPFLIDTAGNAVNFYDTIDWWDDVMHFVTWVPWVMAFGLAVRRRPNLAPLRCRGPRSPSASGRRHTSSGNCSSMWRCAGMQTIGGRLW